MLSVLLVDDDNIEFRLVRALLESQLGENFSLSWASNTKEANTQLRDKKFNYIFLDNRLPPYENVTDYYNEIEMDDSDARVFLISVCVDGFDNRAVLPPRIERVISKFDLKREIDRGLVS